MSTHAIPSPAADPTDTIRWARAVEVQRLALAYFGREPTITDDGTTLSLVFEPDLSGPEADTLRRLVATTGLMRITPLEWAGIEGDIDGLRQYHGLASPTAAQTAAATKALIRVLRTIIRD